MRDGAFPLSLIMTNNVNSLGMIIGPATGVMLISIPLINFLYFRDEKYFNYHFVAISQMILLLFLSQGRADYFSSPIILIFIGNKLKVPTIYYPSFLKRLLILISKNTLTILFFAQFLIFLAITTISLYQTLYSILDYEKSMSRSAYNYNLSEILHINAKDPLVLIGERTPLLFMKNEYIHEDLLRKCLITQESNKSKTPYLECFYRLKAKSIISLNKELRENEEFKCIEHRTNYNFRNPLRFKKRDFDICKVAE